MRLRQVALLAPSLAEAEAEVCGVLGLEVIFRDPAVGRWGLENSLLPLGGDFLELLAPLREGTSAGRYLKKRGGAGGYMVILQCGDALEARAWFEAQGARVIYESDHPEVLGFHFHPGDTGGILVSVHSPVHSPVHSTGATAGVSGDFSDPMSPWAHAGEEWNTETKPLAKLLAQDPARPRLGGVILQGEDPAALAERWAALLGRPASPVENGGHRIRLLNAELLIEAAADGRGAGVGGIVLLSAEPRQIIARAKARGLETRQDGFTACGARFHAVNRQSEGN